MKALALSLILTLTLCVPTAAQARTPREKVIAVVTYEVRHDYSHPSARNIASIVRRTNIDGDGIADWQADYSTLNSAAWCGTGGCRLMLWRGLPGGKLRKVFDEQALTVRWGKLRSKRTLFTTQHGSNCGGVGSDHCPTSFQWNVRKQKFVQLPRPKRFHYHI